MTDSVHPESPTVLVVGGGGREHAIAWALFRSPSKPRVLVAPGNPGTAGIAENIAIEAGDVDALVRAARDRGVALVVVGPEQPLVDGLADRLDAEGIPVMGPSSAAARLEGSKAFAKAFMDRHDIPTAAHRTFTADQLEQARRYIAEQGAPIVVKASGLAAGKGAIVCSTVQEAQTALGDMMADARFGEAGRTVVVEEFMEGEEASIFALSDGASYVLLSPSQDHKRIGEGDTGPNTGGMGAYAPAPVVTPDVLDDVCRRIVEPTLQGMESEGCPFRGVLYCGIMLTAHGPKVVEYNCRLGDPEAQVVLPLLESDPFELFYAVATGGLDSIHVEIRNGSCAAVVMASAGYPGAYEKGRKISGLERVDGDDVRVFHAGTRTTADGHVVTAGGRVLAVSADGDTLPSALEKAYDGVDRIAFDGATFRQDIGHHGLTRLE